MAPRNRISKIINPRGGVWERRPGSTFRNQVLKRELSKLVEKQTKEQEELELEKMDDGSYWTEYPTVLRAAEVKRFHISDGTVPMFLRGFEKFDPQDPLAVAWRARLRDLAIQVLGSHSIFKGMKNGYLMMCWRRSEAPGSYTPHSVASGWKEQVYPGDWKACCRKLTDFVTQEGRPDLMLEIVQCMGIVTVRIGASEKQEPLLLEWHAKRPSVWMDWRHYDLFMRYTTAAVQLASEEGDRTGIEFKVITWDDEETDEWDGARKVSRTWKEALHDDLHLCGKQLALLDEEYGSLEGAVDKGSVKYRHPHGSLVARGHENIKLSDALKHEGPFVLRSTGANQQSPVESKIQQMELLYVASQTTTIVPTH